MYDWESHNYHNDHRVTESAAQAKFDACCDKVAMTYTFQEQVQAVIDQCDFLLTGTHDYPGAALA